MTFLHSSFFPSAAGMPTNLEIVIVKLKCLFPLPPAFSIFERSIIHYSRHFYKMFFSFLLLLDHPPPALIFFLIFLFFLFCLPHSRLSKIISLSFFTVINLSISTYLLHLSFLSSHICEIDSRKGTPRHFNKHELPVDKCLWKGVRVNHFSGSAQRRSHQDESWNRQLPVPKTKERKTRHRRYDERSKETEKRSLQQPCDISRMKICAATCVMVWWHFHKRTGH